VFDVLASRQEDGVPRIGCVVVGVVGALCCQSGAAMLGYGRQRAVIQTIDGDQPLLTMQTIGAPVVDLFPHRSRSGSLV
jgi:hypothetical protein